MPRPEWKRRIFRRIVQALGAIAVTLAGLIVWSCYQRATEAVHLAVVPFRADSGDTAVAKMITDSLAGRLSRVRGFTVLPPTTASSLANPTTQRTGSREHLASAMW